MKKIYKVVFALLAIFTIAMSAAALESKTMYRQDGVSAYAVWSEQTTSGSTDKFISVTKTDLGTDIYVYICSSDMSGNGSCKSGYTLTSDDKLFTMDKKLDSATLNSVEINLYELQCDETGMCWETPAGTVTVEANWQGTGEVTKGSFRTISKYNGYSSKYSDRTSSREAVATGSIDGTDLGQSQYGGMAAFKDVQISMQK